MAKQEAEQVTERSSRSNAEQMQDFCKTLLQRCVSHFAQGKIVRSKDVEDLYPDDKNAFSRVCRTIRRKLKESQELLELLGVPVPHVEYDRGCFRIPVRGFVARINPEMRAERTKLAKALLEHKLPSNRAYPDYLVPRKGTIYFGFGTTVLAAAEHLCKDPDEFEGTSISTSNMEILVRYCVVAPRSFGSGDFLLPGGGKIDWQDGCIIPQEKEPEITTSIVSFEAMDEQGRFYADTIQKRDLVQQALDKTRLRIILVGDKAKFGPGHGPEIRLPQKKDLQIYLFTNEQHHRKFKRAKGVKLIVAEPVEPSNSPPTPPPKNPR